MKTIRNQNIALVLIAWIFLGYMKVSGQDNSLLWKISGNDLANTSYLYGTIHLICGDYSLNEKVTNAIDKTSTIYLELDMDNPNLAAEMQKLSMNKDMQNFQGELSEEEAEKINNFLTTNYGADLSQLGVLKPFIVMSMVLVKKTPCESISGIEQLILEEAKTRSLDVNGLETVAYQMALFDKVPVKDQIVWLMDVLGEDYSNELEEMMTAYKNEDLEALEKIINESPGFDNYVDMLLNQRNINWIPKIEEQIKQGPSFFAVGAGHLPGSQGVISLLKEQGYEVTPVF